jgi:eukaryotic-like serine/threonine-protein kinase
MSDRMTVAPPVSEQPIDPGYLEKGTQINQYTIEGRIGAGGMGATYRVLRDGKRYALKIATYKLEELTPEERRREERRVGREVAALNGLEHPNIVAIKGHDMWPSFESGYPYLVMEYIDGGSLYAWRAKTSPSMRTLATVFRKIAVAINEMHRVSVFHRDLKSDNILVRWADNEPVIIDFGISRPKSSQTVTKMYTLLGTYVNFPPEYWDYSESKECAEGKPFVPSPTFDLWNIGLMFYECVTGRPPFAHAEYESDMGQLVRHHTPEAPSVINAKLSPAFDALILALLEKDPAKRTPSGAALAAGIDEMLESFADDAWDAPLHVPAKPDRPAGPATGSGIRSPRQTRSLTAAAEPAAGVELAPSLQGQPGAGVAAPSSTYPAAARATGSVSAPSRTGLPMQASAPGGGFSPPTGVRAAGFEPPVVAAAPVPEANGRPQMPTAVRQINARMKSAGDDSGAKKNRTGVFLAAGAGVFVLGVLGLASLGGEAKKPEEGPRTLLSEVQAQETDPKNQPQAPVEAPKPVSTRVELPATAEEAPTTQLPADTAPAATAAAQPPAKSGDAKDIDALLVKEYGGRPAVSDKGEAHVVPASGTKSSETKLASARPAAESSSSWLQRGRRTDAQVVKAGALEGEPRSLGVSMGSHIKVRLLTNMDSRTCSDGPVEAVLVRPHVVEGQVVLPSRTMVYGECSAGGNGRFTVRFSRLKLPDQSTFVIDGLAQDIEERKPGLKASRVMASSGGSRQEVGGDIAKGAASTLLNTVTGGTGQEIARSAGQTALSAGSGSGSSSGQDALLLDAGVDFAIFVRSAF